MSDQFIPSPAAWTLLDLLQQHLGVSLELFDTGFRPLAPSGAPDDQSPADDPGIAAEALKALRTGDVHISRTPPHPVGIFPLRVSRRVVGCLVVSRRPRRDPIEPPRDIDIEAAGHLVRTALESDLTLTGQLGELRHRTRRLHGILRFLVQLGPGEPEADVMNALLQAASVWFDVDCRIYRQDGEGAWVLAATLPGAEIRPSAVRLDSRRAERLLTSRRFSAGDGDELGVGGRGEEVLVIPVGGPPPEWILLLSGAVDAEVELTFSAIARLLASDLRGRELARLEYWQQRLAATAGDVRRAPERVLLEMLQALAAETGATGARVALLTDGAERALAAIGQIPADAASGADARGPELSGSRGEPPMPTGDAEGSAAPDEERVRRITVTIEVAAGSRVTVALTCHENLAAAAAMQLRAWITALRPWLLEAIGGLPRESRFEPGGESSPFERRIQEEVERAKRFNLGLGLVLIGTERGDQGDATLQSLAETLRSELRASDLLGRIRGGFVALLLVHSESAGTHSVVSRVRQRLQMLADETPVPAVQLGQAVFSAECATADALIGQAIERAQRFELRN